MTHFLLGVRFARIKCGQSAQPVHSFAVGMLTQTGAVGAFHLIGGGTVLSQINLNATSGPALDMEGPDVTGSAPMVFTRNATVRLMAGTCSKPMLVLGSTILTISIFAGLTVTSEFPFALRLALLCACLFDSDFFAARLLSTVIDRPCGGDGRHHSPTVGASFGDLGWKCDRCIRC